MIERLDGCVFLRMLDRDVYECVWCRRRIPEFAVRQFGVSVLIVPCGEPSAHDLIELRTPMVMHGATTGRWIPKQLQTNELIGQEGGRFDAMYLEGP